MNLNDFIKSSGSFEENTILENKETQIIKNILINNNSNGFITKKIVTELLKNFKIDEIEIGIIKYFVKKNNLTIKNKFVMDIINSELGDNAYHYFFRLNNEISL